jgi:hypothetical protein
MKRRSITSVARVCLHLETNIPVHFPVRLMANIMLLGIQINNTDEAKYADHRRQHRGGN